jgi:predicted signal transduction protein with EAL and GGDEF domain
LLMEVGRRLNQSIRDRGLKCPTEDLVSRLGGDEFAIMLTGLSSAGDADVVAQRILAALRKPIRLGGQECITSASIGIAAYPRDGDDAETLMRCADIAMNAAKMNGKNALQVFKPGLNAASKDRLMLEQAMHKALARNELVMYYQAQIDSRMGKIIGAEALMRWQRDGKLVPPGEFISIAEEIGLIIPFGEWAINNVVTQNRAWVDSGFEPLPIAVNIPGSHFARSNFVDMVQKILSRQKIAPEYLELEITESTLMRDLAATLPTLDALTALGIRLSVDDFGTGYSSLSYLRRLPIDTLKIDASFVRDLQKGSDNEAIVAAIIAMAKSLSLRVIAEGVETNEQMSLLHAYGCHIMQGYYFSKPVPAADFVRFRLEYGGQKAAPKAKAPGNGRVISLLRSAVSNGH